MRNIEPRVSQFLDAIASLEIPYIQVTHLLTYSLTHSQSANNLSVLVSWSLNSFKSSRSFYISYPLWSLQPLKSLWPLQNISITAYTTITTDREYTAIGAMEDFVNTAATTPLQSYVTI